MTRETIMINRDKQWVEKAKEVYNIQVKIKALKKQESEHIAELKRLSEEKPSQGHGFVFNIVVRPGTVDYKKIPQLHGVDLEPYRKDAVSYWKLSYEGLIESPDSLSLQEKSNV